MNNRVDIGDWQRSHMRAAAAQGWLLSETGIKGSAHSLEVQRIDDAYSFSQDLQVHVPQLDNDQQAVARLKQAWLMAEDHAMLAYQILKYNSPSEFEYWEMNHWHRPV